MSTVSARVFFFSSRFQMFPEPQSARREQRGFLPEKKSPLMVYVGFLFALAPACWNLSAAPAEPSPHPSSSTSNQLPSADSSTARPKAALTLASTAVAIEPL